jgi:hypothetical protein
VETPFLLYHFNLNDDGQALPTTLTGKIASKYLIDSEEQERRKAEMKKICIQCHSTDWVNNQFTKLEKNAEDTDRMVLEATKLMNEGWERGIAGLFLQLFSEGNIDVLNSTILSTFKFQ